MLERDNGRRTLLAARNFEVVAASDQAVQPVPTETAATALLLVWRAAKPFCSDILRTPRARTHVAAIELLNAGLRGGMNPLYCLNHLSSTAERLRERLCARNLRHAGARGAARAQP